MFDESFDVVDAMSLSVVASRRDDADIVIERDDLARVDF